MPVGAGLEGTEPSPLFRGSCFLSSVCKQGRGAAAAVGVPMGTVREARQARQRSEGPGGEGAPWGRADSRRSDSAGIETTETRRRAG